MVLKFNIFFSVDDDSIPASSTITMEEMILKQLETAMEGVPGR